jgi:PTS system mannose-specific IIA component
MLGLLVVTHGKLAEELVDAAKKIVGPAEAFDAVSLGWDDDVADARKRIEAGIRDVDQGDGVLVLTDMFGGTPTNIALSLLEPGRVDIVTGVNLPMLIKFQNRREQLSLGDAAERIAAQGRDAIHAASEVLEPRGDEAV